ncbi:cell division initiation protein [Streptomyces chitinivorans]|uniref:Cell division initiation protein n=1 Tax=Streptomyces chitinivorans TaxID=1257027 RepID=A0ABW7I050_9ACTN|nr:cell division initiation protein [Streptomyces chitinivorans]MDH2409588.1 cell division initiation protein [Streptomyces chitinivorans]
MDVQQKLDDIVAAVEGARSMPMSASCVVNRAELLGMLEEVRQALPGSLAQAQELIGDREQMIAEARQEAQRIIDSAQAERGSLVSGTEIARRAQEEADRILAQARQEAEGIRAEADDYVDSKLANFEVVLSKTIGSVDRGREKLLGRGPGADPYGEEGGEDIPERSADPAELRERADAYVEAQFRAFEAVLSKTLEAVGRGRQKLTGHRPIDELGAHLAAQDEHGQQSDADYLADLAAVSHEPQQPQPQSPRQAPQAPAQAPQQPAYEPQQPQQDPYAYQQGGYGYPQEGYSQEYGQPQQDPYAYRQQSPPQPAYQPQQAQQGGYGYPQEGYSQEYGQPQQDPYAYQQQSPPQPAYQPQQVQQPAALDETSFFDTSMIDMEQLRQYEQGR